jgi:hypothetical protein
MQPEQSPEPDLSKLAEELEKRAARERASGGYPDDLSGYELETPSGDAIVDGFDLRADGPRVRFRPELGFSSKPVVGPAITLVKRFYLRLLLYVFEDLARQTDTAIARLETALAVEVASRERLEAEMQRRLDELAREVEALKARADGT